jgi:hypothetical protein
MAEINTAAEAAYDTKRRFRVFLIMFRVCGVPLLFDKVPTIFRLYSAIAVFCSYVTVVASVTDMLTNKEGLEHTMETARALFPLSMIVWMHAFIR